MLQDNDDLNIHEDMEDVVTPAVSGLGQWPHFSGAQTTPALSTSVSGLPSGLKSGHIQVSALGQLLGQNGNIANMVRKDV